MDSITEENMGVEEYLTSLRPMMEEHCRYAFAIQDLVRSFPAFI